MKVIVDENDIGLRLDSFVSGLLKDFSRSKIQNFIKCGDISVNSEIKKPSYQLREGDSIEIRLPEKDDVKIIPQNIHLIII